MIMHIKMKIYLNTFLLCYDIQIFIKKSENIKCFFIQVLLYLNRLDCTGLPKKVSDYLDDLKLFKLDDSEFKLSLMP